jgi:hypothetical protein
VPSTGRVAGVHRTTGLPRRNCRGRGEYSIPFPPLLSLVPFPSHPGQGLPNFGSPFGGHCDCFWVAREIPGTANGGKMGLDQIRWGRIRLDWACSSLDGPNLLRGPSASQQRSYSLREPKAKRRGDGDGGGSHDLACGGPVWCATRFL